VLVRKRIALWPPTPRLRIEGASSESVPNVSLWVVLSVSKLRMVPPSSVTGARSFTRLIPAPAIWSVPVALTVTDAVFLSAR